MTFTGVTAKIKSTALAIADAWLNADVPVNPLEANAADMKGIQEVGKKVPIPEPTPTVGDAMLGVHSKKQLLIPDATP